MKFEESILGLQKIIEKLEDKNTTLNEGIKQFEQGVLLTRACLSQLDKSMGEITLLQKDMQKLIQTPFEKDTK